MNCENICTSFRDSNEALMRLVDTGYVESITLQYNLLYRDLEEGIAYRAGDCDLIYTNGFGFPVWRGGPMHYAGEVGLDNILDRLNHYRRTLGGYGEMWFQPSTLLQSLAPTGRTFNDYDSDRGIE